MLVLILNLTNLSTICSVIVLLDFGHVQHRNHGVLEEEIHEETAEKHKETLQYARAATNGGYHIKDTVEGANMRDRLGVQDESM